MNKKVIGLACDHAAFTTKERIKKKLQKEGYEVKDFGTHSEDSCDYPDYAHPLAQAVEKEECELGFSMCGSGNGITMTVNKYQGIRGALCWIPEIALMAKQHNNANICGIPARYISIEEAEAIVDAFLEAEFEGGRHQRRVEKIAIK